MTIAWGVWIVAGLVIEGVALARGTGTLSGHVWHLMGTSVGRPIVLAFFVWLAWHWFIEPVAASHLRKTFVDDGLIAGLVALLTLMGRRK